MTPRPTGLMASQPALTIGGTISGALILLLTGLRLFGVAISGEVEDYIEAVVAFVIGLPFVAAWLISRWVVAPDTAQDAINQAANPVQTNPAVQVTTTGTKVEGVVT